MAARGSRSRTARGSQGDEPEPRLYVWVYIDRFARGFGKPAPVKPLPRRTQPEPEAVLPWAGRHGLTFVRGFGRRGAPTKRDNPVTWASRCR